MSKCFGCKGCDGSNFSISACKQKILDIVINIEDQTVYNTITNNPEALHTLMMLSPQHTMKLVMMATSYLLLSLAEQNKLLSADEIKQHAVKVLKEVDPSFYNNFNAEDIAKLPVEVLKNVPNEVFAKFDLQPITEIVEPQKLNQSRKTKQ